MLHIRSLPYTTGCAHLIIYNKPRKVAEDMLPSKKPQNIRKSELHLMPCSSAPSCVTTLEKRFMFLKKATVWLILCPETSLTFLLLQVTLPWHKFKKVIHYSLDIDQGRPTELDSILLLLWQWFERKRANTQLQQEILQAKLLICELIHYVNHMLSFHNLKVSFQNVKYSCR